MPYLGNIAEDQVLYFSFPTHKADGTPATLSGTPAIKVYQDDATGTETATGVTLSVDHDSLTGNNNVKIDTSADAFYATGHDYDVIITAGTVDSVSVVGYTVATFSIENRFSDAKAISGSSAAADNLESVLLGTGHTDNVMLSAAQLKLSGSHDSEGALHLYNDHASGLGLWCQGETGALFYASDDGVGFTLFSVNGKPLDINGGSPSAIHSSGNYSLSLTTPIYDATTGKAFVPPQSPNTYYVDGDNGASGNDGLTPLTAKDTIDGVKGSNRRIIVAQASSDYNEALNWASYTDVELILEPGARLYNSSTPMTCADNMLIDGSGIIEYTGSTSGVAAITAGSKNIHVGDSVQIISGAVGISFASPTRLYIGRCQIQAAEWGWYVSGACYNVHINKPRLEIGGGSHTTIGFGYFNDGVGTVDITDAYLSTATANCSIYAMHMSVNGSRQQWYFPHYRAYIKHTGTATSAEIAGFYDDATSSSQSVIDECTIFITSVNSTNKKIAGVWSEQTNSITTVVKGEIRTLSLSGTPDGLYDLYAWNGGTVSVGLDLQYTSSKAYADPTGTAGHITLLPQIDLLATEAKQDTNPDKTGYALASTGLDSVATTAPSGVASTFTEMMVQVWRRFFKKATMTSSAITTFADDGSTTVTSQTIADDGTTQTQGAAT